MAGIDKVMSVTMENLKEMVDVNTIVGDAVNTPDGTTVIPVSKVSFGFASGGADIPNGKSESEDTTFGGGAGGGVSINPVAFLVIEKDHVKLMPVTNSVSTTDKIIDAVPELITKLNNFVTGFIDKKEEKKKEKNSDEQTTTIIEENTIIAED